MKYVIVRSINQDIEREYPIVFPNQLIHKDMAELLISYLLQQEIATMVVSAGEISLFGIQDRCGGHSETLNVSSRGELDDAIISMNDYQHGVVL